MQRGTYNNRIQCDIRKQRFQWQKEQKSREMSSLSEEMRKLANVFKAYDSQEIRDQKLETV